MDDQNQVLHLKIRLDSPPGKIYKCLTSDRDRENYWAEKSNESDGQIDFEFPNGQKEKIKILDFIPGEMLQITYFGSMVYFEIIPLPEKGCILQLTNTGIPEDQWCTQYAGWVSVLLALKAYADHGIDLRNHHPDFTWERKFIDN